MPHLPARRRPVRLRPLRTGLTCLAAAACLLTCLAAAACLLTGCSGGAAGSLPATPPPDSGTSAASASHSSGPLVLDERTRGTTVRVTTGTLVVVRLHSTYWSTPAGSNPQVLAPSGAGTTPAATCPPGRGCGTSSARFTARRPGTAHITAWRTSCGEAMRCSPGQERYEVTVTVTR
ncbi:hypothetical protein SRB17_83410 [Streptomyces sp. RB17]|uniref:hypothetical protein n=1 Tax=Streptomyces sp. RB17 TaxID=2585197 RepID=UPI0012980E6A|nr:hypothetical protein [Streptomyces sp. RB17]MQY40308.1 hypothetical protein [Streptomyces sp. RB17]